MPIEVWWLEMRNDVGQWQWFSVEEYLSFKLLEEEKIVLESLKLFCFRLMKIFFEGRKIEVRTNERSAKPA